MYLCTLYIRRRKTLKHFSTLKIVILLFDASECTSSRTDMYDVYHNAITTTTIKKGTRRKLDKTAKIRKEKL